MIVSYSPCADCTRALHESKLTRATLEWRNPRPEYASNMIEGPAQRAVRRRESTYMKRVGIIGSFVLGVAGLLLPGTASAQQCHGYYYAQQPYVYGYSYGYDSRYPYGAYGYGWREVRPQHKWREREERREREWRRHEWREHQRWERSRWRNRDDWR
jgi:hypothetical protein